MKKSEIIILISLKYRAFYVEARTGFISLVLLASFLLLDQKLSTAPLPSISFGCFFLGLTNKEIQSILMRLFVSDANVSSMKSSDNYYKVRIH
jgi:hypothetical protein